MITELVALGKDSLDSIAYCYVKHGFEVCRKHYFQFFPTERWQSSHGKAMKGVEPLQNKKGK